MSTEKGQYICISSSSSRSTLPWRCVRRRRNYDRGAADSDNDLFDRCAAHRNPWESAKHVVRFRRVFGPQGKDVESGGEGCVDGAVAHHMHPWKTWEMREASIWVLVWVYFCDIGHSDSEEMEPISLQA